MAKASKKEPGKALANWDEKLAASAKAAGEMEASTSTGTFFSIRGGILKFNDSPLPDSRMAIIIPAARLANIFYDTDFDPDDPRPPRCFAFGVDEKTMRPHKVTVESGNAQNDMCGQSGQPGCCPMNEWATANKGRGKACRNVRRIACVPAGEFGKDGKFEPYDAETVAASAPAYLNVPVTSVKGYSAWVKQCRDVLNRPPWAVYCEVKVTPDDKDQVKVSFRTLSKVPESHLDACEARSIEQEQAIEFAYAPPDDSPRPEPRRPQARGRPAPAAGGSRPPVRRAAAQEPAPAPRGAKAAAPAGKGFGGAAPAPAAAMTGKRAARF